ncbi:MAG TPA: multicopper oxidase domain-containing protein [Candidatus Limnocylindrales bacterium]|nr:multicopper oxidase domain-containing protein [Candidatus Limnocylindrales bacterium]
MPRSLLAAGLILALAAAGCVAPARSSWTYMPMASHAAGSPPAVAGPGVAAAVGTIEIRSFELGFEPATIKVDKPGRYSVKLKNEGAILHDVTFSNGTKIEAKGKAEATGAVDVPAAGLTFICSVPGHADGGMKGSVVVGGGTAAGGNDHGGPAPVTSVAADPNAPAPKTYDATAPKLLPGSVHDVDLIITEQEMTVAKGFVQKVWTFGGTVPGPVIRVKVGDTIRVHLKNPATNQLPHSIDFHSSMVAWNDEMTSIDPGGEKVYEWQANYAGVWMYHCGTPPALHHIANGMYGMVIVEPAAGLPKVDREFALVQSEWYLGPQKAPVSLEKAGVAAPAPDYVVFNGVADQYKDAPLQVDVGEKVRVFVLDAGPSIDSSFHVVGTIFDSVIKEGAPDLQAGWGAQAVDLSPAQGAIVEMEFTEDGLYPIVTHAFNFVGRGALGLFKAGDGDPLK